MGQLAAIHRPKLSMALSHFSYKSTISLISKHHFVTKFNNFCQKWHVSTKSTS